jgi:hypothetical protein
MQSRRNPTLPQADAAWLAVVAKVGSTQPNPFLDAALQYAAWGWRVHPLRPKDKKPLLTDWPTKATTDATQLVAWWTEHPDANVSLVPGPKSAGLAVVDVDPRNSGLEMLARLRAKFSDGLRSSNRRGNWHGKRT